MGTGAREASGSLEQLLERLSTISGRHACDPLVELDWDTFDDDAVTDGAWSLAGDPVATAPQVVGLAPAARRQYEHRRLSDALVTAVTFERVLQQGLLAYAGTLPSGSAELRYLYYEVAEEARHSQMFDRLVTLLGGPTPGAPERISEGIRAVFDRESEGRPELLFLSALAGEEPFDVLQRRVLAASDPRPHPLLRAVCDVHVREEARHLAYARRALADLVPRLPAKRRRRLGLVAPIVVLETAWVMLAPSGPLLAEVGVDLDDERDHAVRARLVADVFAGTTRLRELCRTLGIWALAPSEETWIPGELRAGRAADRLW